MIIIYIFLKRRKRDGKMENVKRTKNPLQEEPKGDLDFKTL